jgi:hypothetical protein
VGIYIPNNKGKSVSFVRSVRFTLFWSVRLHFFRPSLDANHGLFTKPCMLKDSRPASTTQHPARIIQGLDLPNSPINVQVMKQYEQSWIVSSALLGQAAVPVLTTLPERSTTINPSLSPPSNRQLRRNKARYPGSSPPSCR